MAEAPAGRRLGPTAALLLITGLGGAMLALHIARYPATGVSSMDLALFGLPRADKLLDVAATLLRLGAINLAAWSLGGLAERLLPIPASLAGFRGLYRIAIGLASLALLVLLLAAAHWLVPPSFLLLLSLPVLLCGAWWWAEGRGGPRRPSRALPRAPVWWMLAACAVLLHNAFFRALGPFPGWDALTYHLAFPERYLFENGIVMTPFSQLSGYIMSTEMLYLLALAIDGAPLAALIHFEFGVLTLVALWQLGRRVSRRAALFAPLFLLADPLFQTELGWAYADLSLTFYATLAVVAALAWMKQNEPRSLVYAGICCGLCVSTRYMGASVLLGLCILLWLPPRHRELRANLRGCLWLTGLAALTVLPWLVRNAVFTGNPVVPLLQSLFHAPGEEYIDPGVIAQTTAFVREIGMGRDLGALAALPWNLTMASTPGVYFDSFMFQVTPLYAIGIAAALVAGDVRRHPIASPMLKLIGIYTLIWFYTIQEPRMLLPAFALIAFVGGVAIDHLASRAAPWSRAMLALPLLAAVYCQILLLPRLPREYGFVVGSVPGDHYEKQLPERAAANVLRRWMGPEDKVMLVFERRGFLFRGLQYIPYHGGSGSPVLQLIHRQRDPHALHCKLQSLGVTHVLWNRALEKHNRPVFFEGYQRRDYDADLERLESLFEPGGVRVFREGEVEVEVIRLRRAGCDADAPPPRSPG